MSTKDINLIIDLLNFLVLNNNYFEFAGNKSFLQIERTAMGKNCAVVFAIISIAALDSLEREQALSTNCALHGDRSFISSRVLVRYIDDYSLDSLTDILEMLSCFSRRIFQGLRRGLKLSDIQLRNTVYFASIYYAVYLLK